MRTRAGLQLLREAVRGKRWMSGFMITSVARLISFAAGKWAIRQRTRKDSKTAVDYFVENSSKTIWKKKKNGRYCESWSPSRTRTTVKLITSLNEITTKRKIFEARTLGDPRSLFTANRKNFRPTTTMKLILKNDAYSWGTNCKTRHGQRTPGLFHCTLERAFRERECCSNDKAFLIKLLLYLRNVVLKY